MKFNKATVKILFFIAVCLALLFFIFTTQNTEGTGNWLKVVVGVIGAGLGVTISVFGIGRKK